MNFDKDIYREAVSALRASGNTIEEVFKMADETKMTGKKLGRRAAAIAIAAALVLALGITAAATNLFGFGMRPAEEGEVFRVGCVWDDYYWKDAKMVLEMDGPAECNRIRFRPGWLPAEPNGYFSITEDGEWYTTLSCEGSGSNQPCRIDVYYASQFHNGGHAILLYDTPAEVMEETWGDYQIMKFDTVHTLPASDSMPERTLRNNYYLMFNQKLGYLIVISSMEGSVDTLEHVGQNLTVDVTDEVISASDYPEEYNRFIDCGVG